MDEFTAADATAESIADAMESLDQMPESRETEEINSES